MSVAEPVEGFVGTENPSRGAKAAPSPGDLRRSIVAFLVLMGYLAIVKTTLTILASASPGFRSPSQTAVFAWPAIAIFTATGLLGVWTSHRLGLPGVWSDRIPLRHRLVNPAGAGLAMGFLAVGIDVLTGWTAKSAAAMGVPSIHIAWPNSLLIYPGGAIIVDVIYYLVPIPILLWLLTRLIRDPARFDGLYWLVGVLAAFIEPVTQSMGNGLAGTGLIVAAFFVQDLFANVLQVYWFRRAGFGAAVVFRVFFYLVWHVGYGLTGA